MRCADELVCSVTTNPFNTSLTCGGSSGGEGALVGFRGSCLGIGTDSKFHEHCFSSFPTLALGLPTHLPPNYLALLEL